MTTESDEVSPTNPLVLNRVISEAEIDEALVETFPASDPPQWTLGTDRMTGQRAQRRKRRHHPRPS